ncbi:hypothetical protein HanHA300_Chr11g0387881 [Helianthus annuus]|nr:hypothetical protein HanHA300_Chr11g0387881 [Helianthus annuus]KAJ0516119.1 hypothetical protein HanHA89_Chr11g0410291 [Helianthus annuus]KAJ0684144.1 hypothetical protein HanLR1_Chr11g0387971 [Helianthus annuus]
MKFSFANGIELHVFCELEDIICDDFEHSGDHIHALRLIKTCTITFSSVSLVTGLVI